MRLLYSVARNSIQYGFETGQPLVIRLKSFPEKLREQRATFVTLKRQGQLRGCIGSLEATRSLVEDVAHNAFAAAFQDSRFFRLQPGEFKNLTIHVSILSPLEELDFLTQQHLMEIIRPGTDGLLLEEGGRRGTFLPSVWETLGSPDVFLRELKTKAGLPGDYWSDTLKVYRYTVEEIS